MKISIEAARHIMLHTQGLLNPPQNAAGKMDVLACIRRMGALQIDTIHVVARSPYFVLWSRLGEYNPDWLDELLAEGALFEYWSHAACFLPSEDFAIYRSWMLAGDHSGWNSRQWIAEHAEMVRMVLSRIEQEGPLRSVDFENPNGRGGTWWDWKEEKIALEQLFLTGQLMISRRQKFQRVYDLTRRVLPAWDDTQALSVEQAQRILTLRSLACLGIALPGWIADYFRLGKTVTKRLVGDFLEEGLLVPVEVEGLPGSPAVVLPEMLPVVEQAAAGQLQITLTTLLTPFDPLVWDRARVKALFDFDYTIEVYTPGPKRRYGYFTLPILHRGKLIGRLDPKAHRKEGVFEVKAIHLEPGVSPDPEMARDLAACLDRCAIWHRTPTVLVRQTDPPGLLPVLNAYLEAPVSE